MWLVEQRTTRPVQRTRTSSGEPRTARGIRMENRTSSPTGKAWSSKKRTPLAETLRVKPAISSSPAESTTGKERGNRHGIRAHLADPEQLWDGEIACQQHVVRAGIGPVEAIPEESLIIAVTAIPAHEGFDGVAVGDDPAGGEHDLGGILQVAIGDEVFEAVDFANGDRQHQHHGEAGVNGSRNKVRGEDRGVPSGNDADGEVEADNGVHGEHKRRGESGEQEVSGLIAGPVAGRAAPSHGQQAVDHLRVFVFGTIAQGGKVGDQADEPEHERDGEVGRDREHIPDERAAELRPVVHGVRVREHPVIEPGAASVTPGNTPAQATAKSVMASAKRLMELVMIGGTEGWRRRAYSALADTD